MYEHAPIPTFDDWNKQAADLLELFSTANESTQSIGEKLEITKPSYKKRIHSARPIHNIRKRRVIHREN